MSVMVISVIKLMLLPPGVLLILLAAGLLFYKSKTGMSVVAVSFLLLVTLSLPIVTNKLAQFWESIPALYSAKAESFVPQAIVVIGGGLEYGPLEYEGGATVNARTLVRLRYAATLARETGLPVLVSGGNLRDESEVSEAQSMASVLINEFNIPVQWQEAASRNTAENARFSRNMLKQHNVDRVILVTHAYHMPRAELEFRKAGFQVLPAPTAFIGKAGGFSLFDWFPSAKALEEVFLVAHECLGMFWYRLRY